MNHRILLIEDDVSICDMTKMNLNINGFSEVFCAFSGDEGFECAKRLRPDLILLDLMLPDIDGMELCRKIRNSPQLSGTPIIMLTAKGEEEDIISGLESGADDYVVKPYNSKILAARIRTQLRKKGNGNSLQEKYFQLDNLVLDTGTYSVTLEGTPLTMTPDEFRTLALFMANPGKVFTRNQIIKAIKGDNYIVTTRAIDMHIVNLRRKLGKWADHLETIRGIGYRIAGE